jgi:hypothetical protein
MTVIAHVPEAEYKLKRAAEHEASLYSLIDIEKCVHKEVVPQLFLCHQYFEMSWFYSFNLNRT